MSKRQDLGCAEYVGRVGALAVALGIGAAVAGTSATAWADTGDTESGSRATSSESSTDSSTSPSSTSAKEEPAAVASDTGEPDDAPDDTDVGDDSDADPGDEDNDPVALDDSESHSTDADTDTAVDEETDDDGEETPTPARPNEHHDEEPEADDTDSAAEPTRNQAPHRAAAAPDLVGMISTSLAALFAPDHPENGGDVLTTMWTMLAWARGQVYNSSPRFDYRPDIDQSLALDGTGTILIANRATDPDGDPARVVKVSDGTKGTVTVNADGSLTYHPGETYDGHDSFTVTVAGRGTGWHLPGLPMFGIGGSNTSTRMVEVTLTPLSSTADAVVTAIRHNAQESDIDVRYSRDGSLAYIRTFKTETFDAVITVVDTRTGAIVHDFDVPGTEYASDIELSPDGTHLVIARQGGQAYWIDTVDVATGNTTTLGGVQQVGYPVLELSPDTSRTLITWQDPATRRYTTSVITTATGMPVATIEGGLGTPAYHFREDGSFLITDGGSAVVSVDADGTIRYRADTGGTVGQVIRHPDRGYTYLTHLDDAAQTQYVSVYDDTTGQRVTRVALTDGAAPTLTLSPDGARLYVVSGADVGVLDTATNTVTGTFTAAGPVGAVAVSSDSATVYVAQANSVLAVDAGSGRVLGSAELDEGTIDGLVVSSDGARAYVASRAGTTGTVSAVNLQTGAVTAVHTVTGAAVTDMRLSPGAGLLLVNATDQGGYGYSRVTVIATGADAVWV